MLFNVRRIYKSEGIASFWKGNLCTCVHRFPYTAINFCTVELCRAVAPEANKLLPGAIAGCVAVTACYPLEVVRTRLMVTSGQPGRMMSTLQHLHQAGLSKTYRGIGPAMAVTVPSLSVSFGLYEFLQERTAHYQSGAAGKFANTFVAGGAAGISGSVVTFPADVIRRRIQVMGMDASLPQRGAIAEVQHLWRLEGMRGFFRGIIPEVCKVFPTMAITFVTYEQLRSFLR